MCVFLFIFLLPARMCEHVLLSICPLVNEVYVCVCVCVSVTDRDRESSCFFCLSVYCIADIVWVVAAAVVPVLEHVVKDREGRHSQRERHKPTHSKK